MERNTIGGDKKKENINYTVVAQSEDFKNLLKAKRKFIVPLSIFFFVFYFTLPLLTAYTKVLNTPAIGSITWAWVFAFAQFIMTWTLVTIYMKKAYSFDDMVNKIVKKVMG